MRACMSAFVVMSNKINTTHCDGHVAIFIQQLDAICVPPALRYTHFWSLRAGTKEPGTASTSWGCCCGHRAKKRQKRGAGDGKSGNAGGQETGRALKRAFRAMYPPLNRHKVNKNCEEEEKTKVLGQTTLHTPSALFMLHESSPVPCTPSKTQRTLSTDL